MKNWKIEINCDDIQTAFRVGQKDGKQGQHKERPMKVTFRNFEIKEQIIKVKSKLKDQGMKIWINEDLTPRINHLAYCARRAVKEGKA